MEYTFPARRALKSNVWLRFVSGIALVGLSSLAHAGRPMATDDAGTVGDKQCQLEAWTEHGKSNHGNTLSSACGLGEFEFGLEGSNTHAGEERERTLGGALKWVPEQWAIGSFKWGAKLVYGRADLKSPIDPDADPEDAPSTGWKPVERTAFLIGTLEVSDEIAIHANVGSARDIQSKKNNLLTNAAISWAPHERFIVFAELLRTAGSPTTRAAGVRYWLHPDKLGLDFTIAKDNGVSDSTRFGLGFGWYGIFGD